MESNENYKNQLNENKFSSNNLIYKSKSLIKEEINKTNEEHILSLRKKRDHKQMKYLRNTNLVPLNLSQEVDLNKLIPLIQNEELYIKFNSFDNNEVDKLNILLSMLINENINLLKFSLIQLKHYLNNIKNPDEFTSKNLLVQLNEKMFRFLFTLLFNKKNEEHYIIINLISLIVSKLCTFNDFYIGILFDYFSDLLDLAKNAKEINIKNSIYLIAQKIFLLKDNNNELLSQKKIQIFPIFFKQMFDELIELNNEFMNNKNIFIIKDLFPTLLNIINNILLLTNDNILNNLNKIANILSFINQYLDISFMETEIIKSAIDFLSIISNYCKENINDKNSNEIKGIISKKINLNKHIISYIYDSSINDNNFRYEIIELINNLILLNNNNNELINNLIEYNICQQISNLQDYLLEEDKIDNIIKLIYKSHIDLIYNLISTQSEAVIQNICIDNSCISNLFQFINNSSFLYNDNLKIIEIFDLIIESKAEYVHSLLLTEGIYDLYKNILFNNKDNQILLIILKDFSIMIQRGKNIKTSTGINFVSNHFIQKGILDLINNIKSRTDLDNQINYLLDEIPKLLEEKTR